MFFLLTQITFFYSLGCGIGYGYLHRIPVRSHSVGKKPGSLVEKLPQVSEQDKEKQGYEPTVHELSANVSTISPPASTPNTLRVRQFTKLKFVDKHEILKPNVSGYFWSTSK
jgi:hypothetical protein